MSKPTVLTVAIQSHNRLHTLRLCLTSVLGAVEHLTQAAPESWGVHVEIWDDSRSAEIRSYLARFPEVTTRFLAPQEPPTSKEEGDLRCGAKRGEIVRTWLAGEGEYLLLLDDDIIMGPQVLLDLVRDAQMLRSDGIRLGALACHGGHTVHREFPCGQYVFAHLRLTGEAAVLLNRPAVVEVGNHFGAHHKGFADTQWRAFEANGLAYVTRVNPPYAVQHIGIADGSIIQHDFQAFWLQDLWRANMQGRPWLEVPNFDAKQFMEDAKLLGCREACQRLWRSWVTERGDIPMGRSNSPTMSRDTWGRIKGRVRIAVLSAEDRSPVAVYEYENVVLDQAFSEFAHLLAGDDQADRMIDRMQFGSGTTPEDATDTGLEIPITPIKAITSVSYPTVRSVLFTAFLLENEANGFPISEIALLFANSVAMTRKTFPALSKSEDFIFEFQYTISW